MGSFLGGRSDRWEYWTSVGLLTAADALLPMLHVRAAVVALFVMWGVTWARRLHDIDISGWVGLIPGIALFSPVLIGWLVGGNQFLNALSAASRGHINSHGAFLLACILVSALIQYGFTIWLGLKAGDPNANRFGPPHGGAVEAEK